MRLFHQRFTYTDQMNLDLLLNYPYFYMKFIRSVESMFLLLLSMNEVSDVKW